MVDITAHFICSLLIGFGFWKVFGVKQKQILYWCLFFALLSGFFVDIDHVYDYYRNYGFNWNLQIFLEENYFTKTNYVLFHGFEYVGIFALIAWIVKDKTKRLFLIILAVSLFVHLGIDIILAHAPIRTYFIVYRIVTNFRAN